MATPRYKITGQMFFRDQLIQSGEIEFDGEPNSVMEPLNDEAKVAVAARDAKRNAKADALAAGLSATVDSAVIDALKAVDVRLTNLEAGLGVTNANVAEHDVGLDLAVQRLDDIEGVLSAAAAGGSRKKTPPKVEAPAPVETPAPTVDPSVPLDTPVDPAPAEPAPVDPETPPV